MAKETPAGFLSLNQLNVPAFQSKEMAKFICEDLHTVLNDHSLPLVVLVGEYGASSMRILQSYQAWMAAGASFYEKQLESVTSEVEHEALNALIKSSKFNIYTLITSALNNSRFDLIDALTKAVRVDDDRGNMVVIRELGGAPENLLDATLFNFLATSTVLQEILSNHDGYMRRLVLTVTSREWQRIKGANKAITKIASVLSLPELNQEDVVSNLKLEFPKITTEEAAYLIEQSTRYVRDLVQPGAAIKVGNLALQHGGFDQEHINKAISLLTKVDAGRLSLPSADLSKSLKSKIFGQDEAIDTISKGIKRGINGLHTRKRTIYNVLAYGESGIGKTLIAEELAEMLTGKRHFLRIDCGELSSHETATAQLIGMPIGYRGYEQGGKLTEYVRKNPTGVILIDEQEKAHPDVLNLFMRALDTGTIASATGEEFDLSGYVFVGTTNAGVIKEKSVGFGAAQAVSNPVEELKGYFKPEYLNRYDDILEFKALSKTDLQNISRSTIQNILELAKERGREVKITKKDIERISAEVADTVNNGRQAYKQTERRIEDEFFAG